MRSSDGGALSMLRILARNAAMLAVTSLLAFATLHVMPGDPVEIALVAWNVVATPEVIAGLRRQWGLDECLPVQYTTWLVRFLAGDWGISFRTGRPILLEMLERLPLSAALGFGSMTVATALAIPLGFLSARRPHGIADRCSFAINVLSQSVPSFWLGIPGRPPIWMGVAAPRFVPGAMAARLDA